MYIRVYRTYVCTYGTYVILQKKANINQYTTRRKIFVPILNIPFDSTTIQITNRKVTCLKNLVLHFVFQMGLPSQDTNPALIATHNNGLQYSGEIFACNYILIIYYIIICVSTKA